MSLVWGGRLNAKFTKYSSAIVKINMANKYGSLHYSIKAYPSPALTEDEWEVIYAACDSIQASLVRKTEKATFTYPNYVKNNEYIEENRTLLRKAYYQRNFNEILAEQSKGNDLATQWKAEDVPNLAIPSTVVKEIINQLTNINKIGQIETKQYDIEVIDRTERDIVRKKEGLLINTYEQKKNLLRYYSNDESGSYVIYYDPKTMLPLLNIDSEGNIQDWDIDNEDFTQDENKYFHTNDKRSFKLRIGTPFIKWSRTVKHREGEKDGILGKTLVINSDTFPDIYKITGETYIRNQKTQQDERFQFTIHRAQVSSDTNITLEAEGEPTVFSMSIDVLSPPNDVLMELKHYEVIEDNVYGGTRIIPQRSHYTNTPVIKQETAKIDFDNKEIF